MALFTGCILNEGVPEDGTRISVMSRHTLNDGITPDERITPNKYDEHALIFSPPLTLVGSYYSEEISWKTFELSYEIYLRNKVSTHVELLAERALDEDITLLCIEETPEKCHRRILAEECQKYQPGLVVKYG